jgi:serine-type D-Ala-D-Ala carboxypeptidase (penicillin-binding protein 5/6)
MLSIMMPTKNACQDAIRRGGGAIPAAFVVPGGAARDLTLPAGEGSFPWRLPMRFRHLFVPLLVAALALAAHGAVRKLARSPYLGAIVVDAGTGQVILEDNADAVGYPASVTKLMTFGVVMDRVRAGQLKLDDLVTASAAAANTGGSQIYLKHGEVFTVDELLYALMVQSANDAAVALAEHVGGSRAAFVELMNQKAQALGLTATAFHSPHGLPPSAKQGQLPDETTARDIAAVSRDLLRHGDILRYSAVRERTIRQGAANPFVMRNHNNLLGKIAGCDGLKTGYFSAAGYSLSATAERGGRRIIAVVLGAQDRLERDVKTKELLERGFASLQSVPSVSAGASGEKPAPAVKPPAAPASTKAPATLKFDMPNSSKP